MAMHGIAVEPGADSMSDDAWRQFLYVNDAVAAEAARLAPAGARVTVHDYMLLPAAAEIHRRRSDVSLVYVHHTPWPHRRDVADDSTRQLLQRLTHALASCDASVVSAHQWKSNVESWTSAARVVVIPPGIEPGELTQTANAGANGYWAARLSAAGQVPVVAAVGRSDPSKNFDTVLKAWGRLVRDGLPGTLCLHLTPTTRASVELYRAYAVAIRTGADEANRYRPDAVWMCERQSQSDALWLLRRANVVVACSRADGWNLVATEAWALGSDGQRLILSSRVGAADVLRPVADLVQDPSDEMEIARAIRSGVEGRGAGAAISRSQIPMPTPAGWWNAISSLHHSVARSR
jgi:trehalose 6-phosphate synthase